MSPTSASSSTTTKTTTTSSSSSFSSSSSTTMLLDKMPTTTSSGGGLIPPTTINNYETDPSVFQFLQTTIQMIYKTRSSLYNQSYYNNHESLSSSPAPLVNIPSLVMSSDNPSSISLTLDDLGQFSNKDIHIDSDEINEINRDLYLWCDHLDSTPLKLDIYSCTKQLQQQQQQMVNGTNNQIDYNHSLLERWIFSFKANPNYNSSNLMTSPNELTISDELTNIMTPLGEINLSSPTKSSNNNNNGSSNNGNDLTSLSSPSLKCLYYLLASMPLYQHLSTLYNGPKLKYGTSSQFPPPLNFNPQDYKDLIKITLPKFESPKGTISISVHFSLSPNLDYFNNTCSLIIYPSRSYSVLSCHPILINNNLLPNPLLNNQTHGVASSSTFNSQKSVAPIPTFPNNEKIKTPPLESQQQQQQQRIITPNNTSPHSTSPSSAPISIPNNNRTPVGRSPSKQTGSYSISKSPFSLNESPSTPPQLSPHFSKYGLPYPPNSPSLFRTFPSPPSSPVRVGHRPLFAADGPPNIYSSPNSIGMSIGNNNAAIGMGMPIQIIKKSNSQEHVGTPSFGSVGGLSFGSFQDSILSGNMSNTPSTQFDGYLANLGVSGKDYLPPHKKISFSAIYYHVDHDIPYVATIDLGPKDFRVPQKGIIQLTLFNPNNTPIKTFLVNFDLTNMPPETKTFIRQRIISIPSTTDTSPTSLPSRLPPLVNQPFTMTTSSSPLQPQQQNQQNHHLLKYAIHLRFISPKRKKYYLYKDIRVVFPNRLPDEMDRLKVVYEFPPEPKYFPIN